jgi:hypothetical protein
MSTKAWPRNLNGAMVILQWIRGGYVRVSVDGRDHDMTLTQWASLPVWYR